MKTRMMMIGIAVAALLLCTESVQAQSRVVRRDRTIERNDGHIDRPDPRRSGNRPAPAPVPERPRMKVVDNEVIRSFERERYDSNRLKMADMIFSTDGYMTTAQITRVAESFDYDSNRVKFLKNAYRNCVDRYNYYMVLGTLDYSSSREKIITFVLEQKEERLRNTDLVRKVSSSDMSAIIKALKNESYDSTREKLGRMIVCGSLLTSRQIADMAKTFSFESRRYDFLVYAYDFCADPQNYVLAAETLKFSTDRSNLMRLMGRR
ncbi:MAG: DUF4476 domain-containing protein [Bacteroidaceae bacterium]|nr:DUF4476 domain-containing protein [Bacteroidaceae bacterium]